MSNIGLNTGLKALLASRFMLDTIGHNLANANTPGYARQRVDLAASLPVGLRGLLIGTGVEAGAVQRSVDALLGQRILLQRGVLGNLSTRSGILSEIESFVGDGRTTGLGAFLDGFFTSVSDLSAAPDDAILRSSLVQSGQTLTARFHEAVSFLDRRGADATAELELRVDDVNRLADEIAGLNVEIGKTESTGTPANDLRDRRDAALDELAGLVDVTTIDGQNGAVGVLVSGHSLVGSARANPMSVETDPTGAPRLLIGSTPVTVGGGTLRALLDGARDLGPDLRARFDQLAHELVLATNRVHSTGIPAAGSFSILTGANSVQDVDGDGQAKDELLSNAGLPFDVVSGDLWVNVVDSTSGAIDRHRVAISATHTTVQDFLDQLNEIPGLSADVDGSGRVRIVADAGLGFDFSTRLDTDPDAVGAFGGARASLGAFQAEPIALADGDTLDLTVDPGGANVSFQVSFSQADFFEISQATAREIADVINADPNAQANGIVASDVGGTLVLQTAGGGSNASFRVDGGNAATALGWSGVVGSTISGQANAVEPHITGAYTGSSEQRFVFRPRTDGVIGTTPDLAVDVFDASGELVTTLQVGEGYVPGTELAVADGVSASFGLGELSASNGDLFALDLVPDSDTSDVLVALGLNGFFTGSNASDIEVRSDLAADPDLIAASRSGAPGDGAQLFDLLAAEDESRASLGGASLSEYYGQLVGDLGFQSASTSSARDASEGVVQGLEERRDSISGVNTDEELVDLVAFEQSFAAAAQYIQTVNQLGDELLSLIR